MRKNIVFLDRSTFPKDILFPRLDLNHNWKNYSFTSKSEVKKRVKKANIIITNKIHYLTFFTLPKFDQRLLELPPFI